MMLNARSRFTPGVTGDHVGFEIGEIVTYYLEFQNHNGDWTPAWGAPETCNTPKWGYALQAAKEYQVNNPDMQFRLMKRTVLLEVVKS